MAANAKSARPKAAKTHTAKTEPIAEPSESADYAASIRPSNPDYVLPRGMARVTIAGHVYHTIDRVNIYTQALAADVQTSMMRRLFRQLWPDREFDGPDAILTLQRWMDDNEIEANLYVMEFTYDALFRPQGAAPRMSELLATLASDDPALEEVAARVDFFTASAASNVSAPGE